MALIKLNGEELVQYGNEIGNMKTDFETLLGDIHKTVTLINDGWDGLAADNYAETYESTKPTLDQLAVAVENLGKTIVAIGNNWIETEHNLAQSGN